MPSAQASDNHSMMVMCEGVVPDRGGCPKNSQREWVKVLAPKIKEGRWPTVQGRPGINKANMADAVNTCAAKAAQHPMSHVTVSLGVNVASPEMFRSDYMFEPIVGALRDIGWIHPEDTPGITMGVMCEAEMPLGTLVQVVDVAMSQEEVDDDATETLKRIAENIDAIQKSLTPEALGKAIAEAPLPKPKPIEEKRLGDLAFDKGKIVGPSFWNIFCEQEDGTVNVYDRNTGNSLGTITPEHGVGSWTDKVEPSDAS